MYIRQMTLISFEEIMEFQQKTKFEMILSHIDVSKLANSLRKSTDSKGPKGYQPASIIYALIAMQVEKLQTIKDLVLNLKQNPVLRYYCGFEVLNKIPSESTFSRFLERLTQKQGLESLFYSLVLKAKELNIVDGTHNLSKMDSFEAVKPKKHIIDDGTVAIQIIYQFLKRYESAFSPSYYAMDSSYDFEYVYVDIINKYNAIPLIDYNPRGSFPPPEVLDKDFDAICSIGYKLVYWWKDKNYLKFRCTHTVGKCDCPHGMNRCSSSNYGYTLTLNFQFKISILVDYLTMF